MSSLELNENLDRIAELLQNEPDIHQLFQEEPDLLQDVRDGALLLKRHSNLQRLIDYQQQHDQETGSTGNGQGE